MGYTSISVGQGCTTGALLANNGAVTLIDDDSTSYAQSSDVAAATRVHPKYQIAPMDVRVSPVKKQKVVRTSRKV